MINKYDPESYASIMMEIKEDNKMAKVKDEKKMEPKKVSSLRAVKPEKIEKRLKLFLFGTSGIGKTTAAIQFPNSYIVDCEKGTEHYAETIAKSGSAVFQSNDFYEIKKEIESLLTEEHEYRTLIIDPMTILYQSIQDHWTRRFENEARAKSKNETADMQDFGMRYWGKVKSDYKTLQRMILRLDMNVIITSHQKDVYGTNFSKIGTTFDSMRGDDYVFDYIFQLEKRGKERFALTIKERAEMGKAKFPEEFVWNYDNFLKYYGGEIVKRKATPIQLASPEQVKKLNGLLAVVNIEDATVAKWLKKADADSFEEFTAEQIQKCIEFAQKKIEEVK